jgi:hypothetical protein
LIMYFTAIHLRLKNPHGVVVEKIVPVVSVIKLDGMTTAKSI